MFGFRNLVEKKNSKEKLQTKSGTDNGLGKVSQVIWLLTFNDMFTWGMVVVVSVFMGLYLSDKIDAENTTQIVGIGSGIAYLLRGITQIPLGLIGDKLETEKDELIMLIVGNTLMGTSVLLVTLATNPEQFYMTQAVFGMGAGLNVVSWRKIFALNLDKGKEGLEYATYEAAMSLFISFITIISGVVAGISPDTFEIVIITIGLLIIASNVWLMPIYNQYFALTAKK